MPPTAGVNLVTDKQIPRRSGVCSGVSILLPGLLEPREHDDAAVRSDRRRREDDEVSGATLQFAVGVNYRVGAASDVLVRNILNGGPLLTKIDVHTGGLIYSLAYQF